MKIIQNLSDMIEEEIADAEKYATCALKYRESDPVLAETFLKLANEEMTHMSLLHSQVVRIIADYRKNEGDPPEGMLMLYDIMHQKHIQNAATAKGLISLYKEK